MADNNKLLSTIATTLALSEQFISSLSPKKQVFESPPHNGESQAERMLPLPLLSASAAALKSNATKLSLLSITAPFTPSAIVSVLSETNDAVLPSLASGVLLISPSEYTKTFQLEVKVLVESIFRELILFLNEVKGIAKHGGKRVTAQDKEGITSATGRLWKSCDQLLSTASEGIFGVARNKAQGYLEILRDAIRELEEWDPEDDDDNEDDSFWDDSAEDIPKLSRNADDGEEETDDELIASLSKQKKHLLSDIVPISKLYIPIISYRFKPLVGKTVSCGDYASALDDLMGHLQRLPDLADEAAGSLYEHDISGSALHCAELRKCASAAVQLARLPLVTKSKVDDSNKRAEAFTKWADTYVNDVLNNLGTEDG